MTKRYAHLYISHKQKLIEKYFGEIQWLQTVQANHRIKMRTGRTFKVLIRIFFFKASLISSGVAQKLCSQKLIINPFLDKHPKVREHYLKGKPYGDLIRCWESDIVFESVIKLTEMNIPTLRVYDSFIVEKHYEEVVEDIINKTRY